jgi:hypothetical protein
MAGTLLPVGYGLSERRGLPVILTLHCVGSVAGGAALGTLLGAGGKLAGFGRGVFPGLATGCLALLYSCHEARLIRVPTPQRQRQVPHGWRLRFSPAVASLFYGAGLGVGIWTLVSVASFYVVLLWAILSGDPLAGAVTLGAYGFFRTLPLIWLAPALRAEHAVDEFLLSRIWPWKPVVGVVNSGVLALSGTLLVMTSSLSSGR